MPTPPIAGWEALRQVQRSPWRVARLSRRRTLGMYPILLSETRLTLFLRITDAAVGVPPLHPRKRGIGGRPSGVQGLPSGVDVTGGKGGERMDVCAGASPGTALIATLT